MAKKLKTIWQGDISGFPVKVFPSTKKIPNSQKDIEQLTNKELLEEVNAFYQLGGIGMADRIRFEEVIRELTIREREPTKR
jgi:hypothetical protein